MSLGRAMKAILQYIRGCDPTYQIVDFGLFDYIMMIRSLNLDKRCTYNNGLSISHPNLTKRLSNSFPTTKTTNVLPFPWFSPVEPSTKESFLVHLLLSMGSFTMEFELFHYADYRQCLIAAQLFTASSDLAEQKESCFCELISKNKC
jgi:hypothetical protein